MAISLMMAGPSMRLRSVAGRQSCFCIRSRNPPSLAPTSIESMVEPPHCWEKSASSCSLATLVKRRKYWSAGMHFARSENLGSRPLSISS